MRPVASLMQNESAATATEYDRDATAIPAALVPAVAGFDTKPQTVFADHPNGARVEQFAIIGCFVVLSVAFFYAAISRSIADHFWMDEVLAVSAASQSSLSRVWDAIWTGTDFSPPTYHFFLHGFVKAVGAADGRIVWRVPSILAVYGAALCTYMLLVKSQLSRFVAVLAFGIVLAFNLFDYAIQVRQYALLALGLAAALLLWSGIEDTRAGKARTCCLWLVLTACLCLHFYGIIEVAVIATAELIYGVSRGRFRIAVWTALLLTVPVEAALYPLAAHLATFNNGDNLAPGYYGKPTLGLFLGAVAQVIGGGELGRPFLLSAFLAMGAAYLLQRSKQRLPLANKSIQTGQSVGPSKLEIVIIALAALPLMTFAFSLVVTKSFSARYMAAGALLPAIAVAYMLDKLAWRRMVALALVPLIAGILIIRSHAPDRIADVLTVLQKNKPSLPIVVGEGLLYIELMQAADTSTRSKLVYLKKTAGASSPDPTNENEVVRLATFLPDYRVSEQSAFLRSNPDFYVLSRPNMSVDTTSPALMEKRLLGSPVDAERGILLFRSLPSSEIQQDGGKR